MDIQTVKITSENVEQVLRALISDVDNIEEAEARLKLDLRGMVKLLAELPHNDDMYHNGETVLQHMRWVLEDLDKMSDDKDAASKQIVTIAALLHDLGKAYTHEVQDGKHTYYKHALKSVDIAEVLLAKHQKQLGDTYQRIIDLVRLLDTFLALANERKQQTSGQIKYLNKFLTEAVYMQGHMAQLVTLARADSARSKAEAGTVQRIEDVLSDIAKAEAAKAEQGAAKARQQANWQAKQPEIRALLEVEMPEAAIALPEQSKVNAILGQAKRFDLIKKIQALVTG